ncbi:uncharacterized protein LOC108671741 [Hyalella azteca]|uniref:Uncharacterized protein LOC108671741 n=1 Tax=Hyalella azteca TaxID=294128 RepID=A0A8B7NNS9_HYAAZ|nr:uncharacterized protein LOC108671741 [Hyalella azteca]
MFSLRSFTTKNVCKRSNFKYLYRNNNLFIYSESDFSNSCLRANSKANGTSNNIEELQPSTSESSNNPSMIPHKESTEKNEMDLLGLASNFKSLNDKTFKSLSSFHTSLTNSTSTQSIASQKLEDWTDILNRWYGYYQDVAGISEVHKAQERVNLLIDDMSKISAQRQELQITISELHHNLNHVHSRIGKSTPYSEEHTQLFDQARHLFTNLEAMKKEFQLMESRERECLTNVMFAIRVSHEKERTQQQHTNYRTLMVSLLSAAFGSVVAIMTNMKRTRDTHERIQQTELHAGKLHQEALQHTDDLHEKTSSLIMRLGESLAALSSDIACAIADKSQESSFQVYETKENISLYKVSIYMATGAALGTLMAVIVCNSIR